MYESPVNVIYGEMQTQIEGDVYKAIQNVGIDVNKEELLKALMYDREQYSKGYSDGYAKAIDDFVARLSEKSYFTRSDDFVVDVNAIEELAEQMKEGAE